MPVLSEIEGILNHFIWVAASRPKALGMVIFNVILSKYLRAYKAPKNLKILINNHSSLIIYSLPPDRPIYMIDIAEGKPLQTFFKED